ncbi:hypothetical protein AgCh_034547 [Apium graveolens]
MKLLWCTPLLSVSMVLSHKRAPATNTSGRFKDIIIPVHTKIVDLKTFTFFLGARRVATLLNEMKQRGKDSHYGVISMCIGSGHHFQRTKYWIPKGYK